MVHLIRGDQWIDLAKFTVNVEGPASNDAGTPAKGSKKPLHHRHERAVAWRVSGTTKAGTRAQFQDLTTGALNWEGKPLGWDTKTSANLTGVSKRSEAPGSAPEGINAEGRSQRLQGRSSPR